MTKAYPVEGAFLSGIPHAEHDCTGKGEHALCFESGAFSMKKPPTGAAAKQTEAPPSGGALDSPEE